MRNGLIKILRAIWNPVNIYYIFIKIRVYYNAKNDIFQCISKVNKNWCRF